MGWLVQSGGTGHAVSYAETALPRPIDHELVDVGALAPERAPMGPPGAGLKQGVAQGDVAPCCGSASWRRRGTDRVPTVDPPKPAIRNQAESKTVSQWMNDT